MSCKEFKKTRIYILNYLFFNKRNELIAAKYKVKQNQTPTEGYVHPYHSSKIAYMII